MYVCICHAVTDRQIRDAIARGATSLDDLTMSLGVGTGCGCCREIAANVIDACRGCPQSGGCAAAKLSA